MTKINLNNFNWYNLNHDYVKKTFEGKLEYVGSFCIKNEYIPRAFYFNSEPNRNKNHKDYLTLQKSGSFWYVSGIDKELLEEYKDQAGILCNLCSDAIYSVMQHDCRYCSCKNCFIDGGRNYIRIGGTNYTPLEIDLITGIYKIRN